MDYQDLPRCIKLVQEEIEKVGYEFNKTNRADGTPKSYVKVHLDNYSVTLSGFLVQQALTNRNLELQAELAKLIEADAVLTKVVTGLLP